MVSPGHYITLTAVHLWQNDTGRKGGDRPAGGNRRGSVRGWPGRSVLFVGPLLKAHLLTTSRWLVVVLPTAAVRPPRKIHRMRIQLRGKTVGSSILSYRASVVLSFLGFLMGLLLPAFTLSGNNSVRETNAQPAPATGLFKGFGTLSQQAKADFRQPRRKSVLSICGNKCTACAT